MLSIFFDGVSKITYSFFSILFDSPDLSFNFTLYFTGKSTLNQFQHNEKSSSIYYLLIIKLVQRGLSFSREKFLPFQK